MSDLATQAVWKCPGAMEVHLSAGLQKLLRPYSSTSRTQSDCKGALGHVITFRLCLIWACVHAYFMFVMRQTWLSLIVPVAEGASWHSTTKPLWPPSQRPTHIYKQSSTSSYGILTSTTKKLLNWGIIFPLVCNKEPSQIETALFDAFARDWLARRYGGYSVYSSEHWVCVCLKTNVHSP